MAGFIQSFRHKDWATRFRQFLEATDQDTLIDQSLTVIVEAIP